MKLVSKRFARTAGIGFSSAALVALAAGGAAAHITIKPQEAVVNTYSMISFSVGHGCDGSPTRSIQIKIPEQVTTVTPMQNPSWFIKTEEVAIVASPDDNSEGSTSNSDSHDSHGDQTSPTASGTPGASPTSGSHGSDAGTRVSQVTFTAKTPLPADIGDLLSLTIKVPDVAGQTLSFPVVQKCSQGETKWNQVAKDGEDPHSLERPAPTLKVVAEPATSNAASNQASEESSSSSNGPVTWIALIAGVLGLALGGAAFAKAGKSNQNH